MTTELVQVNPSEYGIEESKASELVGSLPQIIKERDVLLSQYDEVVKMDIESPLTAKRAKEVRILIKNNRTKGIESWHKTTKDYFLKGGQFVDAIKRKEIAVNERMESQLEEIENYAAKKEAERIENLRVSRVEALKPYEEFVPMGISLGTLSDEEYQKVFNGAKLQYEAKIDAEKKAEEERIEALRKAEEEQIAKEKSEAEERERVRIENERLKKEAEDKERQLAIEREEALKKQQAIEAKAKKEREEAEMKAEAERVKQAAILKAEREEKARLEAKLKAKADAESLAEKQRIEAEEKARKEAERLAKSPVKKQLTAWVETFDIPPFTTQNELSDNIFAKFESFKKWAKSEIEKM